jgi:hypothetical protein
MPKIGSYVTNPQAQEFYNIASNSDRRLNFVPKSFQPIGIKQGQSCPTIWHKLEQFSMLCQSQKVFLNNTLVLYNLVTIHGRKAILVWVVVNTKIPVIQVFEHQKKAKELFEKLLLIDKEKWGNATYTIFVERSINPLRGDE